MMQAVQGKLNAGLPCQKQLSTRRRFSFTNKLDFRKKLVTCYIWNIVLYGAGAWTLWKVDQKHLECFEMWCWRRMEKIGQTDHVRNGVLQRVKKERNILQTMKKEEW
jgi:hypothetical protein